MRSTVQIDGLTVVAGLAVIGAGLVYWQGRRALAAVNPADPDNVINAAVTDAVGEERISSVADHIFGAWDLLNPLAPEYRRDYAKQVWFGSDDGGSV